MPTRERPYGQVSASWLICDCCTAPVKEALGTLCGYCQRTCLRTAHGWRHVVRTRTDVVPVE